MKRAVGFLVLITLLGGAVWLGLASRPSTEECVSGLQLCASEALIEAEVLIERCSESGGCAITPYEESVFLQFIELDRKGGGGCGPGDCGAAVHALQSGWHPGRWRIIAPRLDDFAYLTPPDPIDITLVAGKTYDIDLFYRDHFNQWPPGPFAHNCSPENADGDGDFDGDGLRDRVEFYPGYSSHGFSVGYCASASATDAPSASRSTRSARRSSVRSTSMATATTSFSTTRVAA